MSVNLPEDDKKQAVKLSALILLSHLGWQYIPPIKTINARYGQRHLAVLKTKLLAHLRQFRFLYEGIHYPLSQKSLDYILDEICHPALNEGLQVANEKLYQHMLYGISVTESIAGQKVFPTVSLVDWQNPEKNQFHYTQNYPLLAGGGEACLQPDIVCFVNGLPWVAIEVGESASSHCLQSTLSESISRLITYQHPQQIPQLFAYSQLLLAINGTDGCYATQGTEEDLWAIWREEEFSDSEMVRLKEQALDKENQKLLFSSHDSREWERYCSLSAANKPVVSGQAQLLIGLLSPQRLLELTRHFIYFHRKHGKMVTRYAQYFAVKSLLHHISQPTKEGGREGGVIWHSSGSRYASGQSITLLFSLLHLLSHPDLKSYRFVVVTERFDLIDELTNGQLNTQAILATSGKGLARLLSSGRERIMVSLLQKFITAIRLPECQNNRSDIILLIDLGDTSYENINRLKIRRSLPNAAFIIFTGTSPLQKVHQENADHKDKQAITEQFGRIIHSYSKQQALRDDEIKESKGVYTVTQSESLNSNINNISQYPFKEDVSTPESQRPFSTDKIVGLPDCFAEKPHIGRFFKLFKSVLSDKLMTQEDSQFQPWIDLAFQIDQQVSQSVAENSIRLENMETDIRQQLLPVVFSQCKAAGAGLHEANKIIHEVIQIVRKDLEIFR